MSRKCFIFLEFTRERTTANEMIDILIKSGQASSAQLLKTYNTSPKFMPICDDIELKVIRSTVLQHTSKTFKMDLKPRGKAIIINNIKDDLIKESFRFVSIFKQLHFDVDLFYDMKAHEIKELLESVSKEERLNSDQAFILMIISHGFNEKVIGFDGNELRVTEIVDIFSEVRCSALRRKPKLFFFNCCRNSE